MKDEIFELNEPQAEYRKAVQKTVESEQEPVQKRVSLDEYLEMIADGTRRLEYHDGEVVDIQSATQAHGKIATNLTRLIGNCLLDKECDVYAADREIWIEECNKTFYPDLVVVCGEEKTKQMSKNVKATVNPSVVIEILSDSTEKYDKTFKSKCYKKMKSMKQIIYVSQDEMNISIESPTENARQWLTTEYFEEDDIVPIGDCEILLKDIYRRVIFTNQGHRAPNV
jgi:Uma2 family endonuclease